MIGTRIESRNESWLGPALALLAAAGCLGMLAVSGRVIWLCIAVLPLLVAAALWLSRPKPFALDVLSNGLMVVGGPTINFEQIEFVTAPSLSGSTFPVLIEHAGRQLLIPARLNVPSRQLLDFLAASINPQERVPRDPDVAEYYGRQQSAFGPALVAHFAGRKAIRWPNRRLRLRLVLLACVLAGIVYLWYGIHFTRDGMVAGGGLLVLFGSLALLISFASGLERATVVKNRESASLVLCPAGLALAQAELKGELRWDEIRDVKLRDREARVTVGTDTGGRQITLLVDGAAILIRDIYDQPLAVIHRRIVELWK